MLPIDSFPYTFSYSSFVHYNGIHKYFKCNRYLGAHLLKYLLKWNELKLMELLLEPRSMQKISKNNNSYNKSMTAINLVPTLLFTGLRVDKFIYLPLKNQCKKQNIDKIRRAENKERKQKKWEERKNKKDKNILFIHPADYSLFWLPGQKNKIVETSSVSDILIVYWGIYSSTQWISKVT